MRKYSIVRCHRSRTKPMRQLSNLACVGMKQTLSAINFRKQNVTPTR